MCRVDYAYCTTRVGVAPTVYSGADNKIHRVVLPFVRIRCTPSLVSMLGFFTSGCKSQPGSPSRVRMPMTPASQDCTDHVLVDPSHSNKGSKRSWLCTMPPALLRKQSSRLGGGGEPCTLCAITCYPAEKICTSSEQPYHQKCLRCTKCSRPLTQSTYNEDAVTKRLYCHVRPPAPISTLTDG